MEQKKNFVSDLLLGQYYETKYIEKRGFEDYHHPKDGAFKDYDIKNNETGKSYEVKADRKTKATGNLFIECKCNGEYSGINATKADYWIHFVCNGETGNEPFESDYFYYIKTKKLRQIVKQKGRYVRNVGDGGRVEGIVISENYFKDDKKYYIVKNE
jgi:hypothetical protein